MRKTASVLCKSLVGPTTTFQLLEERQKQKNYAHVYRRDTDVFLPDFFLREWASVNRLEAPLYSIKPDHDTASKITHTSLIMCSSFSTS